VKLKEPHYYDTGMLVAAGSPGATRKAIALSDAPSRVRRIVDQCGPTLVTLDD
jgi:hypothetical protein